MVDMNERNNYVDMGAKMARMETTSKKLIDILAKSSIPDLINNSTNSLSENVNYLFRIRRIHHDEIPMAITVYNSIDGYAKEKNLDESIYSKIFPSKEKIDSCK